MPPTMCQPCRFHPWTIAGGRGRRLLGEGGVRLTTNNHNAIHNALSLQDYMVYFQWGLAHPSQAFIGPSFLLLYRVQTLS